MRSQTTRTIGGRVNADGTPQTGSGFTSRRLALGSYALTFPGARLLGVNVSPAGAGAAVAYHTSAYTGDGCNVGCFTVAAAPASYDNTFAFTATVTA